jgi:hypothetical protein
MPRGSKSKYTSKQIREAKHIEEGYEKKGVGKSRAKAIGWATVNKDSGGGEKSGSGTRKSAASKKKARSSSAKTAAQTRKAGKRRAPSSVGKAKSTRKKSSSAPKRATRSKSPCHSPGCTSLFSVRRPLFERAIQDS